MQKGRAREVLPFLCIAFRSAIIFRSAPVAQWTERGSPKAEVMGSTPIWGFLCDPAQAGFFLTECGGVYVPGPARHP